MKITSPHVHAAKLLSRLWQRMAHLTSAFALTLISLQAQAQSCPEQTINWTVSWLGTSCSAKTSVTPSGAYAYVYDSLAPQTGWAGLKCVSGVWQKPNSYECKGPTATSSNVNSNGGGAGSPAAPAQPPVFAAPVVLPADVAAARLLEQATFGPRSADIAVVKQIGAAAWIDQQITMPATAVPLGLTGSVDPVRNHWMTAMTSAPDQLRQRMIFALSQIMVVSSDKNPYAQEITPWLQTLNTHAFGTFSQLLREMTLNPAMGKYLALGHSRAPAPNEDFAREVMQLFTIGLHELNMDGSYKTVNGQRIPAYSQTHIGSYAQALSGWSFPHGYEDMSASLVATNHHDMSAKTLLSGNQVPAGQTPQQDFDAVMNSLLKHPNLAPFISVRLIRHFVTSNPTPSYVQRVAAVFQQTGGNLGAVVKAILLDSEARNDTPTSKSGRLKDPLLHTISLIRALGGTVSNPQNLHWDFSLMGQRIAGAPSVFSFYSPLKPLPGSGNSGWYGPEFQIYSPSHAVRRANFLLGILSGQWAGAMQLDISPYTNAASDPQALMQLVNKNLLQGRMSATARQAIGEAVWATTSGGAKERALTALYLTAITAEFAVQR